MHRKRDPIGYARKIGVKLGEDCRFCGVVNFGSEPYLVSLGSHVSVTDSNFITHDGGVWVFRDEFPKVDMVAPIKVGNNVFIGMGCTILPGVIIGDNVVIGAGSIVTKSLPANGVYAGIPAKKIKSLDEYKAGVLPRCVDSKLMTPSNKERFLKSKFELRK
ncbi:acyltransferase [Pontiellaceae bacterium B12219]|nr:acyltransferase [Pontiellaceae bacterium B12219]